MSAEELKRDLYKLANPKQAKILQRFFKTGKGEYGEGDVFLGIKVPEQRKIAKKHKLLKNIEIEKLLKSKIHEHRLTGVFILVLGFNEGDEKKRKQIYNLYLKSAKRINNWDLVDSSAPYITGPYLKNKSKRILYKLAKSKNIWERRIAIMSTFTFIKNNDYKDTIKISEILLTDKHDLIHKAVGWMLREVGNRDLGTEEIFLTKYSKKMPRTMLRYAIEKFTPGKKKLYMQK